MRNFKRLAVFLVLIMTTVLYGCGGNTPTDVVNEYFGNIQKGNTNVQDLFNMVAEEGNAEDVESDSFSEETSKKLIEKMKGLTYKVNKEEVNGDSAKVNVTVKGMDLSIVIGKVMQEAFGYMLSQAFTGVEMTEEESNKYFEGLFIKYLDEVTYNERTEDITLKKVEKEWKIEENDALSKLVMGIDSSTFSNLNEEESSEKVEPKEMVLNAPFKVETDNGDFNITIEGARATEERNEFSEKEVQKVVFLDYTYENISYDNKNGMNLFISDYDFQVLDDEGNVLDTYPVSDENRSSKETPVGGKCKSTAVFGVPTDSANLNVTFTFSNQQLGKIIVPIK